MATSQNKIVLILTGLLLLVIIGSIGVLMLLDSSPSDEPTAIDNTATSPVTDDFLNTTPSFDLSVLQRQSFQLLGKQLVTDGALPVKPPATTGKANPFL